MANGVVERPSVEQANVDALRNAYERMQALPGSDNRSWISWAGFHGFPRYDCWHHGRIGVGPTDPNPYDLFLPWHRAYLMYWDHVTRDHDEAAILPWWDWTFVTSRAQGVPEAYAGDDALATGPTPNMPDDPARRTRRFPGDPAELPTPEVVDGVLALRDFVDFSTQVQDLHDQIHGWAGGIDPANPDEGGDMGSIASAAYDPLFWAHHAMIDRLWYLWQLEHGVDNIPPDYLRQSLAPFGYTVEQVLDTRRLGYEYATSSVVSTEEDR